MSMRIMVRKCVYCRHRYTYNPSTGSLGLICPKCGKVQPKQANRPQFK